MITIVGILGSATPPGRLSHAIEEALGRAATRGHRATLVNLGTLNLGWADARTLSERGDDAEAVCNQVALADAVLFASPVYRASFTGVLKNLLDLVPVEALLAKPCGIVAMGATQHHYLGVESHLRDVLAWFGALVSPSNVYLSSSDFLDGVPTERAAAQLDSLVESLVSLTQAAPNLGGGGLLPLAAAGPRPARP